MAITIQDALTRCIEHREIFHDEMLHLFRAIMRGEISDIDLAALTVALRTKKETIGEITAAAQVMREFSSQVSITDPGSLLDVVGTGGDGAHTFNISTASIFVAAACGVRCAKHGGKSVSSSSGSADVLQTLGANIMLAPEAVAECVNETGIGFMYAPMHHLAMKHAANVRKQLGIRTIFNILGPLTNPAGAQHILMGVFHPDLVGIQVRVLERLGAKRALVVWGRDNLDEASLGAATMIGELRDGEILEYDIHPEDYDLPMMATRRFSVSNADESALIIKDVLSGKPSDAANIVMLNSALALYVADKASSIPEGLALARSTIESGAAYAKLQQFIETTERLGRD